MDKYDLLQQIGDGTFGSVAKAVHKKSGQLVAIKRMKQKYYSWEECVNLPEVQVLRKLQAHPNIIKLREVVRENNELFFVFEFMDGDLLGVIRKSKQSHPPSQMQTSPAVPYSKVKSYMFQLMQSLAFLHKSGFFHRDLKPENLLIRKDPLQNQEVVKLADFGLVKEVRARPPYTDYVSTRWYRAPELLLQDRAYSAAVDVWAAGCIFAELMTTKPLFPGNNEVDQLFKIMSLFGAPNDATWADGMVLARKIRYQFPIIAPTPLKSVFPPHVPPQAIDLLSKMLVYDPKKRINAQQCLAHPYFNVGLDEEPLVSIAPTSTSRMTGGIQSAPTVTHPHHLMHTPVQWRQAADKNDSASANKVPSAVQPLQSPTMANANRPASGNRPMYPPVEISKHVVSNPQSQNESNLSKYYLVPSGLSPNHNGQNAATRAPPVGSSSIPVASKVPTNWSPPQRPPTKVDSPLTSAPTLQPISPSPVPSAAAPKASPPPQPQTTKKAGIDLDALMSEFEYEMTSMGFQTHKEAGKKDDSVNNAPPPLAAKSAKPPTSSIPSTVGIKGLPIGGANNTANEDATPIQKLLQSSRYKPSTNVAQLQPTSLATLSPSVRDAPTPTFLSHDPPSASKNLVQLNSNVLASPAAVTAANRYDLDSSSFASLDVGAALGGSLGGRKAILGNAAVSPSVHMLLTRQAFKPGAVTNNNQQEDVPTWLRMANEKNKRTTPDLSKGHLNIPRR